MPGIISVDHRVSRTFALNERAKLQLIAEACNGFNHTNVTGVRNTFFTASGTVLTPQVINPANPFSGVGINAFGTPSSANATGFGNVGRVLQFAAKINF